MKFDYFDIHSHLDWESFDEDREEIVADMRGQNIGTITVGVNLDKSRWAVDFTNHYDGIWACIGMHPEPGDRQEWQEEDYQQLIDSSQKVVAIGECGLDYLRINAGDRAEKKHQRDLFATQIDFAVKNNLPVMVHSREATAEVIDILRVKKNEHGDSLHAHIHFYTEPVEVARQYLDLGCTLSFTGVITFVPEYEELVKYVPLEMMMVETDSPFVAPAPKRGRRNDPRLVRYIAEQVCALRPEDDDVVKRALLANTTRIFGIET